MIRWAATVVLMSLAAGAALAQTAIHAGVSRPASDPVFGDLASFYASLPVVDPHPLDRTTALQLSTMPLSCMDHPQPRPNAVPYIWEATYTPVPDYEITRAFYGCYDWHSAVNSAWTLVRILKAFPDLPTAPAIRQKLNDHFGASNVAGDLQFFRGAGAFELPYGYAWLLRLQYELRSWNDSDAVRWAANIQPMASYMSERMITYLKELRQPVRTGVHPNTAMAMDNALRYARSFDPALEAEIRASAERLFKRDVRCNTAAEPGPSDFASPCLMEAAIMGQLMDRESFLPWLDAFLPQLYSAEFRPLTKGLGPEFVKNPAAIASKSHIVGLAFVRATSMGELANALPPTDPRVPVLRRLAAIQAATGFPLMGAVGYDGSHYYASWATTYLITTPSSSP
ncbi:MAG TPA: DUF2891 family protein [Gemmatimonadaceae bacterium]|nr:DUF2891 family protein [Gemmatimonadaceae bacterium]